ncbi:MAG: PTS sugar transporter subunit IIA, partial [Candidatus Omnitrophica bacterium]|nr:PTS sugar transporter subunit IIA [Candidatus Omnitrophota bacterium]
VDEYLQDKIVKSPERGTSKPAGLNSGAFPLSRLTDESCIDLNLKSKTVDGILYELAEIAYKSNITVSVEKLMIQLKKREQMLSTAIGKGIAIPHPRNPSDDLFKKACIVIGRSVEGANFNAPDNKAVKHVFLIIAPYTNTPGYLATVARLVKVISDSKNKKALFNASTKKDILMILKNG